MFDINDSSIDSIIETMPLFDKKEYTVSSFEIDELNNIIKMQWSPKKNIQLIQKTTTSVSIIEVNKKNLFYRESIDEVVENDSQVDLGSFFSNIFLDSSSDTTMF